MLPAHMAPESYRDADQLRRLQVVTDAALSHLDLEALLAELLSRIREILAVDTVAILLLDDATNELVARAAIGIEEEVEQGVRIPVGRGFAGRVAARRQPVFLPDLEHADVLNPILRQKGITSLLGVPLLAGGDVLGVLHVGSLTPREFTAAETELLQIVAERASLAIEHARLYATERAARVRLENVQKVTDAALAHLDLEELLAELLARIREILAVDTVAILLIDESGRELVARAAVGIEEEVEQGVRIPVGRGFAGRIAASRRPVFLPDVDHADVLNPILRQKGIKSLLGVPLLAQDEVVGVLHVGSLTSREFGREDTELLRLVADRAAIAIERARLHDAVVRLDQLKLNFVAVASHELRTPAASVYGILATLRAREGQLTSETRELLEATLWEQAERLRRLIEQLLDLSRLDSSAVRLEREPLRLRQALGEVVAAVAGAENRGRVSVDVPDDLIVTADRLALERAVGNLVANALRHGRPPVRVSAAAENGHVRIAVEDAGGGVPSELVPRLFERFERGGEGYGSGLGLAIARTYALAQGGDLVYVDGAEGARFELLIPDS